MQSRQRSLCTGTLLASLFLAASPAFAQDYSQGPAPKRFQLAGLGGYQAGPSFPLSFGTATIEGAPILGGSATVFARPEFGSAFEYAYSPASLRFSDPSIAKIEHLDVHHGHLAAIYNRQLNVKASAYGSIGLGATVLHAEVEGEAWFWSFALGGGLKYFFTPAFGIQGEVRALIPFRVTDGAFLCSSKTGCAGVITGGTAILQMTFTAGPVIAF